MSYSLCPETPDTVVQDRHEVGTTCALAPPWLMPAPLSASLGSRGAALAIPQAKRSAQKSSASFVRSASTLNSCTGRRAMPASLTRKQGN